MVSMCAMQMMEGPITTSAGGCMACGIKVMNGVDADMTWIITVILMLICAGTGFLVGFAYGQEERHEQR